MQQGTATFSTTGPSGPIVALRDLLELSPARLDELYASASAPAPDELDGDYDGLLLSGQFPGRRAFPSGFVNGRLLPWRGKTFTASARRGRNRIQLGRFHFGIWPFETSTITSQFGGGPTLSIGYEIKENPFWLRHTVFDELRRLRDGLYLGKGGIRLGRKNLFVFHWALAPAAGR